MFDATVNAYLFKRNEDYIGAKPIYKLARLCADEKKNPRCAQKKRSSAEKGNLLIKDPTKPMMFSDEIGWCYSSCLLITLPLVLVKTANG